MENKDGVPGGKRLFKICRSGPYNNNRKGNDQCVVDWHSFHAEPDPKKCLKAEFFNTLIYTSACLHSLLYLSRQRHRCYNVRYLFTNFCKVNEIFWKKV
jgi:hypothetical protein